MPPGPRAVLAGATALATLVALLIVLTVGGGGSRRSPENAPRGPSQARRSLTIAWVGDITLSAQYGLPSLTGGGPLAHVRRYLQSDLMLGNLEGTLGSGGRSKCRPHSTDCYTFRAPASYARLLGDAGFDVMNVANNHAYDFGPDGQRATLRALGRANVGHAGQPGQTEIRRVRGTPVALLGFAPYPWASPLRDLAAARSIVQEAARRAQVVVVMMHAGAEGADRARTPAGVERAFGEDRGDTRAFAHAAVDAGADLVLGSGPHVVRGVERYRGRLIAYSLGDFLGNHTLDQGGVLSLSGILRVRLAGDGSTRSAHWTSLRLVGAGTPRVDPRGASAKLVTRLSRADFGPRGARIEGSGRLESPGN